MRSFAYRAIAARVVPLFVLAGLSLICIACGSSDSGRDAQAEATPAKQMRAVRGEYLVTVGACNDCHTPMRMGEKGPEPDMTRMLSGHPEGLALAAPVSSPEPWIWGGNATNTAFHGPWGVSYGANLTSDSETGIGAWTETMFVQALRTGKHMGSGRDILPPMPWPAYSHFTDEDLKSIHAYLRTVPPIRNSVPLWTPPAAMAVK